MASVTLRNLTKEFTDAQGKTVRAVNGLNLEILDGEFLVLVGPSGCGKTTALRMLAGLEEATAGEILIGDNVVNNVTARDRDIAMVFQSYALYPHMSVYDNMAFGLKLRMLPPWWQRWNNRSHTQSTLSEIDRRIQEAADLLDIKHLLGRKPKALSGGQRQRVALGRAIVREPQVFLMDEPLSNLDAKLRVQTRTELIKLHRRLGVTTVYVTHDQVEAMTMGQRIAVMRDGVLQQCDTPLKLYHEPANMFVAGFLGTPAMNFLPAQVQKTANGTGPTLDTGSFSIHLPPERAQSLLPHQGEEVLLGIRPENIHDKALVPPSASDIHETVRVDVEVVEPMGAISTLFLRSGQHALVATVDAESTAREGNALDVVIDVAAAHVFDKSTEQTIV
jgi:multiple sugar transport system ATP-binding protein